MHRAYSIDANYEPPPPRTTRERFQDGADLARGLSGAMPLNSQPDRHSRRIEYDDKPAYGDDIANGVSYE